MPAEFIVSLSSDLCLGSVGKAIWKDYPLYGFKDVEKGGRLVRELYIGGRRPSLGEPIEASQSLSHEPETRVDITPDKEYLVGVIYRIKDIGSGVY